MAADSTAGLGAYIGVLEDPRMDRTKRHKRMDIIIAIWGVIRSADSGRDRSVPPGEAIAAKALSGPGQWHSST